METKILVIYIGIAGIRSEDIEKFVRKVTNKISPTTLQCEIITIPVQDVNTRIECINPKYITDESLINEHTEIMKKLQEELNCQLEILKKDNKNE
jgi:hypothetical protein